MEKLSVIITSYNKDDLTVAHVRNCMDVSRIPDEIIIVNDGGKKALRAKLKKLERKCQVIYVRIDEDILWNYHGACNLAYFLSRGDYLAFEDNDNFPSYNFYACALQCFKDNPKTSRVQAGKRKTIGPEDILNKPRSEWRIIGREGANMGTAMIPRDFYMKMKGHDERFCGRYGWMYYDWRSRAMAISGRENYTRTVDEYFYNKQGQSDLDRSSAKQNRGYYIENARRIEAGGHAQHPEGILNFTYEFEIWPRNKK